MQYSNLNFEDESIKIKKKGDKTMWVAAAALVAIAWYMNQ